MEFPRWGYATLCGFFIAAALLFATGLLSAMYGQIAAEGRFRADASSTRFTAARDASQLQPWSPAFAADLAWAFAARSDFDRARVNFREALRLSPANGYLWLEYAQALARGRRFDPDYALAMQRATALSPNAPPVRIVIARMGAVNWGHGGQQERAVWAQNLAYALRNKPGELFWHVLRTRREAAFCGHVGAEFGLSRWCFHIQGARQICDRVTPDAKGEVAARCARLSLTPLPTKTNELPTPK